MCVELEVTETDAETRFSVGVGDKQTSMDQATFHSVVYEVTMT